MEKFKTISEHEILNYAWLEVLKKYQRAEEQAKRLWALGKSAPISEARMEKLKAQEQELHDAILELEKTMK